MWLLFPFLEECEEPCPRLRRLSRDWPQKTSTSGIPKAGKLHFVPKQDISHRFYSQTGLLWICEEGYGNGRETLIDPMLCHPEFILSKVQRCLKNIIEPDKR
jgi:hypothetical protein